VGLGARAGVTLRVRWLGRLPYLEAWDLQRSIHEGRVTGRTYDDYLLLLEHPPTYTTGRFAGDSPSALTPEAAEAVGAELHQVDRGGDITFHGPGQLVGYPIVSLGSPPDLVGHVRRIEETLIAVLADLGVEAWREDGYPGVWTASGKVAAIGVRAARQVTTHGFALNVATDLSYFDHIVPCGISERPVTSLERLLERPVSIEEVVDLLVPRFAEVFGAAVVEEQRAAFTRGTGRTRPHFEIDDLVAGGTFGGHDLIPITTRGGQLPGEPDKPSWMKVKLDLGPGYRDLKRLVEGLELNTVCEEAACPNIYECWGSGTATFMLLGDVCTRACGFCDVNTGRPGEVDWDEPKRVAEAVVEMGLEHAVLTSVNRDDLPDGGSELFARTIGEIHQRLRSCEVEVLIPDFKGDAGDLSTVLAADPTVLNHNTETVIRLQREIRTAASYGRSLALLGRAKRATPEGLVKSGLIVGMGETKDEVLGALADMRAIGVDIVTIGQYLRPTARHRKVHRYVHPDEFAEYKHHGESLGLPHVESGPLVRSSYHAKEATAGAVG